MKATIITYKTDSLTTSKRSIISKTVFGYKDKTAKAKYTYHRKGIIADKEHIIITKKTFIVRQEEADKIIKNIKKLGAETNHWNIDIKKTEFT